MPILRNPRHELFAQGLAKGLSGKAAYCEAGYRSKGNAAEVGAAKLVRNGKIAARVAELQARQVRRLDVTVERITDMLIADRELALSQKQAAAAVSATMALAKLHGLVVDRSEVQQTLRKPLREPLPAGAPTRMSVEEWQRRFAPQAFTPQPTDHNPCDGTPTSALGERETAHQVSITDAIRRAKAMKQG